MVTIERSADFAAPPERVYALLADETRMREWRDDLVASERLSPPGPMNGVTYRETIKTPVGNQVVSVKRSAVENLSLAFEVTDGAVRPQGKIVLTALPAGGTHLVYRIDLAPMFGIPSPLDAAAKTYFGGSIDRGIAKLRTLLGG